MEDAIQQAVQTRAVPVQAGDNAGTDSFAPLTESLDDTRVVGVGLPAAADAGLTGVHTQLLRYLVAERGVRVIGYDGEFAAAFVLGEYLAGTRNDLDHVLERIDQSPWRTAAGVSFLEWLRSANADRGPDEQVRVAGLAARTLEPAVARLVDYVEEVDPAFLETVQHNLDRIIELTSDSEEDDADHLAANFPPGVSSSGAAGDRKQLIEAADRLLPSLRDRLDAHQDEYTAVTDRIAWERATHLVTLLEQAVSLRWPVTLQADGKIEQETASQRSWHLAALGMADNADWLLGVEAAESMAVVAAAPVVARSEQTVGNPGVDVQLLGSLLDARYGQAYYALGFEHAPGSASSPAPTGGIDYGDTTVGKDSTPEHPVAAALATLETDTVLLDFKTARANERLAQWLDEQSVTAAFDGYCVVDEWAAS
jgi:erythromycin esterase-like protein